MNHVLIHEFIDMAYTRFSNSDTYMFYNANGKITCCACSLAPKIKSIFTYGTDSNYPIFKNIKPCSCKGKGCDDCMIPGSIDFTTFEEAIKHLKDHQKHGDYIPISAFEELQRDLEEEKIPTPYEG